MFHPLPVYVGLRYVRARSQKFFVSFITWASVVGVCVGVAALIVILSVMNGFAGELRDRLLSTSARGRVRPARGADGAPPVAEPSRAAWQGAARSAAGVPGVSAVTPYAELQALAVREPQMVPVIFRGIEAPAPATVTELGPMITQGRLADLAAGSGRIIVGDIIAERLGLS